jgi:hypothetical protein
MVSPASAAVAEAAIEARLPHGEEPEWRASRWTFQDVIGRGPPRCALQEP